MVPEIQKQPQTPEAPDESVVPPIGPEPFQDPDEYVEPLSTPDAPDWSDIPDDDNEPFTDAENIDYLKQEADKNYYKARHDARTGLLNVLGFNEAGRELEEKGKTFAAIGIDLDKFKKINDTFGHEAGDKVLTEIAKILKESARPNTIVGRLGGDEFAILVPVDEPRETLDDKHERTDATLEEIAEMIRERIAGNMTAYLEKNADMAKLGLNISSGVGLSNKLSEAMSQADASMYANKQARKRAQNKVKTFISRIIRRA